MTVVLWLEILANMTYWNVDIVESNTGGWIFSSNYEADNHSNGRQKASRSLLSWFLRCPFKVTQHSCIRCMQFHSWMCVFESVDRVLLSSAVSTIDPVDIKRCSGMLYGCQFGGKGQLA